MFLSVAPAAAAEQEDSAPAVRAGLAARKCRWLALIPGLGFGVAAMGLLPLLSERQLAVIPLLKARAKSRPELENSSLRPSDGFLATETRAPAISSSPTISGIGSSDGDSNGTRPATVVSPPVEGPKTGQVVGSLTKGPQTRQCGLGSLYGMTNISHAWGAEAARADTALKVTLAELEENSDGMSSECDAKYGFFNFQNTRRTIQWACKPRSYAGDGSDRHDEDNLVSGVGSHGRALADSLGESSVYCHVRKPVGTYHCVFENAELTQWNKDWAKKPLVAQHKSEFLTQGCTLNIPKGVQWGWWEKHSMEHLALKPALECTSVVEHDVILYPLWCPERNIYEFLHDFITLFETLALFCWSPSGTEAWLYNIFRERHISHTGEKWYPFIEWIEWTFQGRPIRTAENPYPVGTCFRRITLPPSPGLSTLTAFGGRRHGAVRCRAPIVSAMGRFVTQLFPGADTVNEAGAASWSVTILHRAKSSHTPRYMDSEEVARRLRLLLGQKRREDLDVRIFDPVNKPTEEGVRAMRRTTMLVGLHGAGLSHIVFLPAGATLFEFFCGDRGSANGHYQNIATMLGLVYWHHEYQPCGNINDIPEKISERLPKSRPQRARSAA